MYLNFAKKSPKKEYIDDKIVCGSILFTDIVGSSKLWKKYKDRMFKALQSHEKLIYGLVKKHKGVVVKTIGDSFMLFFKGKDAYIPAIKCAMDIQRKLIKNPIYIKPNSNKDAIRVRIGICHGKLMKQHVYYQGIKLQDYFGNTVNIASRMESKVAERCAIAFSMNNHNKKTNPKLLKVFKNILGSWKVTVKDYRHDCNKVPKKRKRSSRLIQGYKCLNPEELKGVGSIRAYMFTY